MVNKTAYISWILVLLAPLTLGFSLLLTWFTSWLCKPEPSKAWLAEHKSAVRAVFWWTLFWSIVGYLLTMLFVGWIILAILTIWLWAKAIQGIICLKQQKAPY